MARLRRMVLAYLPLGATLAFLAGLELVDRVTREPPPPIAFDADEALRMTGAMVGDGSPRFPGTPSHERARDLLRERLGSHERLEVRTQPFEARGQSYENVLAVLPGSPGAGVIVLGAHYDTRPLTPGAVDNASGVGILLEVARHAAAASWRRTIVFGFWDGEEEGLLGSRHYVESLTASEREAIVAAVHLDMPGWKDGRPVIHTFRHAWHVEADRHVDGWLVRLMLDAAARAGEPLSIGDPFIPLHYQIGVRNLRVPFASDDGPFLEAGIPALFFANSAFTGFLPVYHQPGDGLDMVGVDALRTCGRTLSQALAALDERVSPEAAAGTLAMGLESDAYIVVLGRVLPRGEIWIILAASLLPVVVALGSAPERRDPLALAAGLGIVATGVAAAALVGRPQLAVVAVPLAITFPWLRRRSPGGVRAVALAGLLPAMSVFLILLLIRLRFGAHAPLHVPPLVWVGMSAAPLLYLAHAVRCERAARRPETASS